MSEVEFIGGPVDGRRMVMPTREDDLWVEDIVSALTHPIRVITERHLYRRDPARPDRFERVRTP